VVVRERYIYGVPRKDYTRTPNLTLTLILTDYFGYTPESLAIFTAIQQ